jgi:hypothetical protein
MTFRIVKRMERGYMADLGCSVLFLLHEEGCNDWLYISQHLHSSVERRSPILLEVTVKMGDDPAS